MSTFTNTVSVKGDEINEAIIARIRTMVAYEMDTADIVAEIPETATCPARWVAFVAENIRNGKI